MIDIAGLNIKIDSSDAKTAKNDLDNLRSSGKTVESQMGSMSKTAIKLGASLAAAFSFQQIISRGITAFSDLDKGLIGVQKTTGLADAEIKVLGSSISKISLTVPVSTKRLLELAEAAGQLGVKGRRNIETFTETMAKLETATDVTGEEGAKAIARLLTVTHEAISTVPRFGSVLVALGNNSAASEKEILSLATEIGQATSVFSVSAADAAALGAAMKSMGVSTELGGSVIGRAMREIESAIKSGGEQMKHLMSVTKMTEDQLTKTFKNNATLVFKAWIDGVGGLVHSGKTAEEVLAKFNLKGEEVLKVLPAMAKNNYLLADALKISNDEVKNATALNKESMAATKSFSAQLLIAMNHVDLIASSIGKGLAPVIIDILDDFRYWVDVNEELIAQGIPAMVGETADKAKQLQPVVKLIAETLGVMAEGFLSMPASVQTGGLIGAFLGGKYGMAIVAGVSFLTAELSDLYDGLNALKSGGISMSDFIGSEKDFEAALKKYRDLKTAAEGSASDLSTITAQVALVKAEYNKLLATPMSTMYKGEVEERIKSLDSLRTKIAELEKQEKELAYASINKTDWKAQRDLMVSTFGEAKDKEATIDSKANATSISGHKSVTASHNKELEQQVRAFERAKEEQKRALESFDEDYKKVFLSTFDYEIAKLDEKYEYFKSQKVDEVRLEEWYAEEHFRINQEDIARYYDAQEQKIAAQKKIQEEQLKLEQEAADEAKRISDEAAEAQQEAYDELYDGVYGFTRNVIDDWDDMGNTLVDMAESMVKDIIAAFVTQKIAIPIYMYAADMAGISTGLASGMSPSSGGFTSMTSPISSLFTIGKTAYTLVTEGVSAAVSDLVGADLLGSISSAMFGETAATAAGTAYTTISPTVASTIESAYAVANGGTATSTGAASGAGMGGAAAAGLAVAAFMAIDQFLGSHDQADPDIYVQSPTGGLTESTATYTVSNRDAVTDEIVTIFDAAFASLDESLDANIVDAVTASAFRGKARITDLDETDANALINSLVESAFSGNYTGSIASFEGLFGAGSVTGNKSVKVDGEDTDYWNNILTPLTKAFSGQYSKGLSDILMEAIGLDSGIFNFDFLKSLQAEGENLFDTFANFAIVVQETDGFVENITRQMNEFGFTVEEAFANILVVISVLDEMQASADALTTVTSITTLKQLTESWYALIDSLEAAYATTSQISDAESTMATVLGASISGLTADALQSALSSGGDIDSIINTAIETSAYADIAQKIAEEYVSGINNQIGQVWLDTDGDLQAVIEVMQNIDTTEAQKAIAELRESFGLLSDTTEDQANDIAEYNELLAAAAAKSRELSIDILYAQGEAEQALAMEREDIINDLVETYGSESATIIDLQKQLWALNDAAEATTEVITEVIEDFLSVVEDARSNYENALNTALSAAKSEYDTLVESFKSAEDQLNTVRAAHIEEQKTLLQEQTDAYSDSIADLTDELSELESIAANLKEYREGLLLGEDSPLLPGEMLAEAQAQFAVAGPEDIVDASQNLLSAGQEALTDYKEYAKLFAMVQSGVSGAESDVKTQSQALQEQIDMASVQVELLNAEIDLMSETSETLMSMEQAEAEYYAAKLDLDNSSYEEDIAFYEKELDRLDRINGSVLSLDQATQNYQSALIAAISQGYNNLEYNFQAELNELEDTLGVGASFAGGGIISGPASGYNVVTQFHGTEMIIPESKFDSLKSDKESDEESDEEIKILLRTLILKVAEGSQHSNKIHRILNRVDAGQGSLLVRTT